MSHLYRVPTPFLIFFNFLKVKSNYIISPVPLLSQSHLSHAPLRFLLKKTSSPPLASLCSSLFFGIPGCADFLLTLKHKIQRRNRDPAGEHISHYDIIPDANSLREGIYLSPQFQMVQFIMKGKTEACGRRISYHKQPRSREWERK